MRIFYIAAVLFSFGVELGIVFCLSGTDDINSTIKNTTAINGGIGKGWGIGMAQQHQKGVLWAFG